MSNRALAYHRMTQDHKKFFNKPSNYNQFPSMSYKLCFIKGLFKDPTNRIIQLTSTEFNKSV